jgi:predicted nicotinamide N-methyase
VLSAYIVHRGPDALAGKRVLELGSGTGLVGLAAAKLAAPGAQITVTDQASVIPRPRPDSESIDS